jgi:hypothetical protein
MLNTFMSFFVNAPISYACQQGVCEGSLKLVKIVSVEISICCKNLKRVSENPIYLLGVLESLREKSRKPGLLL